MTLKLRGDVQLARVLGETMGKKRGGFFGFDRSVPKVIEKVQS